MVLWQWSNPLAQFQLDEALPFLDCQETEESLIRSHVKWCWMVDSVQQTCDKSVIVVRNRCLEGKVVRSLPHFHPAKEVDSPSPVILLIQKQYAMVISICIISFDSLKNNGSSRCYRNTLFPMLTMMGFFEHYTSERGNTNISNQGAWTWDSFLHFAAESWGRKWDPLTSSWRFSTSNMLAILPG